MGSEGVPAVSDALKAPFPYFGGKSRVASDVWARLGSPARYIEPFAGSLAVLLARPRPFTGREIVNDADGLLVNVWRAMAHDPDAVAEHADWPATEPDLHARHAWLVENRASLTARLEGDPDFFDAKVAGWWVWGISAWLGSGWCSGRGPWRRVDVEGHAELRKIERTEKDGVWRQIPNLASAARGVSRQLPFMGTDGMGVHRKLIFVGNEGRGVHRKLPHVGDEGRGVHREAQAGSGLYDWFDALAARLRRVRVASGDWSRVMTPAVTTRHGLTGIFLDPPYDSEEGVYSVASSVAKDVLAWCRDNGSNPELRIVLAGYAEGAGNEELESLGWRVHSWSAKGGYGNTAKGASQAKTVNRHRERLWMSPHCLPIDVPANDNARLDDNASKEEQP